MKKIILVLIAIVSTCGPLSAQSVGADNIHLVRQGSSVTVDFDLITSKKAVKSSYNLIVTPVLKNGADSLRMAPVVVQGRRAKIAGRVEPLFGEPVYAYTDNGSTVHYQTRIAYAPWMTGADMVLDAVSAGCCTARRANIGVIARNVLHKDSVAVTTLVEVLEPAPPVLVKAGFDYPFVAPVAEYDQALAATATGTLFDYGRNAGRPTDAQSRDVENYVDANRDKAVTVYFRQGSKVIDRNYMGNNAALVEFISAVRTIAASDDARVVRVTIAGFASPEGSIELNTRLALDRAKALKEFVVKNAPVDESIVNLYNGMVDWNGLRKLVSGSNMAEKARVVDIIDNTPVWDSRRNVGRRGELMRLNGGETYRYIFREFFPKLRSAAYIKVYYENK